MPNASSPGGPEREVLPMPEHLHSFRASEAWYATPPHPPSDQPPKPRQAFTASKELEQWLGQLGSEPVPPGLEERLKRFLDSL